MSDIIVYTCVAVLAYLIGSISPAIKIAKFNGKNIMKEGSGNAGATNAVRILGTKMGLCVFVLDFLKGFFVTLAVYFFFGSFASYVASVAVVVGHVFSVFYKFKAGKGVAPSIGVAFAVDWKIALICFGIGIILVAISKRVSIGSITAAIVFPVSAWFLNNEYFVFALIIGILIVFTHRSNIVRLFKGEEKPLKILVK